MSTDSPAGVKVHPKPPRIPREAARRLARLLIRKATGQQPETQKDKT